jgi:fibrillarin-like pre-rRNA processing protein
VAVRNARFLPEGGRLLLAVKARSEDVTADPDDVFDDVTETLSAAYEVLESTRLGRFHDDHLGVVARRR